MVKSHTSEQPCNTTPTNPGAWDYVMSDLQAKRLIAEFVLGVGKETHNFGPNSRESRMMSSSPGVLDAVALFLATGETENGSGFGIPGAAQAGLNPIRQFVGGYHTSVAPVPGGLMVTVTNRTSVYSGSYHLVHDTHSRYDFATAGNTYQTYQVYVPCG